MQRPIGVNLDKLLISQPDSGEKTLDIACRLIASGKISLLVVDSVVALVPEAELVGNMVNMAMGLQARMMGQAMRKQSGIINKTDTVFIYINQLREKTGMVFGNPEVTPGGKALKFFASLRLDIKRAETLKQGYQVIGIRSKVKVVKSKLSSPLKTATIDIIYGKGIAKMIEVIDLTTNLNLI
nr:hypothetical protein ['Catharanthus roseus' aster yellows phytoplasma]